MVAIVSGNSLGLELTSLGTLGSQGMWGLPGQGSSGEQVYVNAANGNLVVQRRDEFLASHGLDNQALRTYNSLGLLNDGDNGDNWSLGVYAQQLLLSGTVNTAGSTLTRTGRDGAVTIYTWDAARACYFTTDGGGAHDTITYNASTSEYSRIDGSTREVEKYTADANNGPIRLRSVTDADGNSSTYNYTGSLLTSVVDKSGDTVTYTYTGNNLTKISTTLAGSSTPRSTISYAYDASNRLSTVTVDLTPDNATDSVTYTTSYTYDGTSKRIKTLTQLDGSSLTFTYDASNRVASITDALGSATSYAYTANRTTVTDPTGQVWLYDYDGVGQLTKLTSPAISGASIAQSYTYDASGNVTSITNGDGEKVTMAYDANGNQTQITDALGNAVVRTYSAANQLLTETTSNAAAPLMVNQGGVSIIGSDIVKTGGGDLWNASFRSSDGLANGASVSFKPAQTDKALMVGLNSDPGADHDWDTLDFAIYCTATGTLHVRESGSGNKLTSTVTYAAGDDLRVTYDGTTVSYLKNGAVFWTTTVTTSQKLYADSSFHDVGAKITNLIFGVSATSGGVPLVAESNTTVIAGGTVTKTAGSSNVWDASARSLGGFTGGAMVAFKPGQTDKYVMVGLNSDPAANDSYSSIDYAFFCQTNGTLCAYENGTRVEFDPASPSYATTDTLKVVYTGSKIQYVKVTSAGTTTVLREVTVSIGTALYLDSSFYSSDARIDALQFGKAGLTTVMAAAKESGIVIAGDTLRKTGGTSGNWDSAAHSDVGYAGQANLSFTVPQADRGFMIGLNTDPEASYSWSRLDWAFYCTNTGGLEIREAGSTNVLTPATTYAAGDKLQITYDGSYIRYLKNGVELRSVAATITEPLYVDASFYHVGAKVTELRFGDRAQPLLTTRYIYSATKPAQLRYAITPEGYVTQYQYNSYGERSAQISYPRKLYSVGSLASDAVPTEAQMNAWVTAIGDLSNTLRKDFTYDARGLLASVIEYEGVTSAGAGTTAHTTQYIYDQAGRLLQTIQMGGTSGDEAGAPTTTYTYDGLGRVLTASDPHGVSTSTVYTDSAQKAVITYQSGAVATSTYDKAGRLISLARSGAGSTTYAYDKAGHLLMTKDALGVKTFNLYDEAGRQVASIDGDGTLTETRYDKASRVSLVCTYASAVDLTALADANGVPLNPALSTILPAWSTSDLIHWNFYDDAGRLVYEVADNGALTRHEYDGTGRLVRNVTYSVTISTSGASTASITAMLDDPSLLAGAANDRSERFIYDADGRLAATIDAEGYFTRNVYDYAGRKVSTYRYANQLPENERAGGGTVAQLLPTTNSVRDQVETFFYDARGLLIAQVDAKLYLTVNTYDNRGLLSTQTRYATALSTAPSWFSDVNALISGATTSTEDRTSTWYYNRDGQLLKTINFEGLVTFNEYDAAGRLIKTTQGYGRTDKRVSEYRYDAWGRKTAQLSGEGANKIVAGMTQTAIDAVWTSDGEDFAYDSAGRLISTTDANNFKTLYFYDNDGHLTHTVNARGEVEENRYNALGQRTAVVHYGTAIATSSLVGGLVNSTLTTRLSTVADAAKDSTTRYDYNGNGRLYKTTSAEGAINYFTYNAFGQLSEQKSAWQGGANLNVDLRVDQFSYDRRGSLLSRVRDVGGIEASTSTEYDAFGRVTKSTNANGKSQTFAYDKLGRVVTTTDPLTKSVTTTYDAFGQVLTVKDQVGQTTGKVTTYTYDPTARSVTMTTPEGVSMVTTRNAYGETYAVKVGDATSKYYSYDRDGNLIETKIGSTVLETRSYDAAGLLVSATDQGGTKTTYTYDAANRMLTRTVVLDPNSSAANLVTTWEYDPKGQAIKVTDPRGTVTEYTFDLDGRTIKQVVDPTGLALTTDWTYDAEGRTLTVVDANRVTTQYTYDKLGRRKTEVVDTGTGHLNLTRTYDDYDDAGNLLKATDANNNVTRYRYDDAGRLSYIADAEGSVTRNDYDARGNLSRQTRYLDTVGAAEEPSLVASDVNDLDQVTRYFYDDDGRLEYSIDANGAVAKTEYDTRGNIKMVTRYADTVASNETYSAVVADPTNDRIERFAYDTLNRLAWHSDATGAFTQTEYDTAGNVKRTTRYAILKPGLDPSTTTREYDPVNDRINDYRYDAAHRLTYTVDSLGYVTLNGYDKNGNVTSIRRFADTPDSRDTPETAVASDTNDRVQSLAYDRANRLTKSTDALGYTEEFTFDANGNKKTFKDKNNNVWSYDYDKANRLTQQTSPAVDLYAISGGNGTAMSTTPSLNTAVITKMTYDGAGNLKTRTEAYGRPEARTTSYDYDKVGRQTKITYPPVSVYSGETAAQLAANGQTTDAIRKETLGVVPTTQTWYDSFGNAVATQGLNGKLNYKSYDKAGRVSFEVDALGYVTGYDRNAFGDATTVTRYDNAATALKNIAGENAARDVSTDKVSQAIGAMASHSLDRTITTVYDQMGRGTRVTEGASYTFDSSAAANQAYDASGGKATVSLYNAFGEVIRTGQLVNRVSGKWQYSYQFYDQGGRRTLLADTGKFLTSYGYDSEGNLTAQNEFFTATTATIDIGTVPTLPAPDPLGRDRSTTWTYDKLNRVKTETKVGVQYFDTTTDTKTFAENAVADVTTSYGYDGLGHQTWVKDGLGKYTYTYYDALGRIEAIAAPSRTSTLDGTTLIPLVQFQRDAHGNVLAQIDRAKTATGVTSAGYTAQADAQNDRATFTRYDSSGHAMEVQDAGGAHHFSSFTQDGKLAKSWQSIVTSAPTKTTLFTAYVYDELGRLTQSIAPSPVDTQSMTTNYEYNGFGEVIKKGRDGLMKEYFNYDNAGKLVRTNSNGGIDTVYLYDLLGRQTAEIRSSGRDNTNVVTSTTAIATAAAWTDTRRINTRYNALGQVIERKEAARITREGGLTVRAAFANAVITSRNYETEDYAPYWTGNGNRVNLTWSTLEYLGSGEVKVEMTYLTQCLGGYAGVSRTKTDVVDGCYANTGYSLYWGETDKREPYGSIESVTAIKVSKKDINGEWVVVIDRDTTANRPLGTYGTQVEIAAPADPSTQVTFKYKRSGTSDAYTPVLDAALIKFGDSYWFNANGLATGSYDYEVWFTDHHLSVDTDQDGVNDETGEVLQSESYDAARQTESGTFTTKTTDTDDSAETENSRSPTITFLNDRWANVLEQNDPRQSTWKTVFTYNAYNQVTSEKRPDAIYGNQGSTSPLRNVFYDKIGRQVAVQDANGFVNVVEYDGAGNVSKEIHADGGVVTYAYDAFGQKVQMVDAVGNDTTDSETKTNHTTAYGYDKLGHLLSTQHGITVAGAVASWYVDTSDDGDWDLKGGTRSNLTERFTYDEAGRKLTQTNGDGGTTYYTYDRAGNVVKTMQPGAVVSSTVTYTVNASAGRIARKETDANGNWTSTTTDYFGRVVDHTDLAGHTYTYTYADALGAGDQLVHQTNSFGQDLSYSYDGAGQLVQIVDAATVTTTNYDYDLAGNRVRELVKHGTGVNNATIETLQDNHLAYDTLGRLIYVADNRVQMTFAYDKVGNRTRVQSHVLVDSVGNDNVESAFNNDRYFAYDEMNRQTLVDGTSTGGITLTQGHKVTYDKNGNRVTDTFYGTGVDFGTSAPSAFYENTRGISYTTTTYATHKNALVTQSHSYDAMNRLIATQRDGMVVDRRFYDGAGRVVQSGPEGIPLAYATALNKDVAADEQIGLEVRRNYYDGNGRLLKQRTSTSAGSRKNTVYYTGTAYDGTTLGYDGVGNVKAYQVTVHGTGGYTSRSKVDTVAYEGYVEKSTSTTTKDKVLEDGSSTSSYDVNGFLIGVSDATEFSLNRSIVNDAAGHALRVTQNGNKLYSLLVNGELMGQHGVGVDDVDPRTDKNAARFEQKADFGFGFRSISGNYPSPTSGTYTVHTGDSLQSIAQAAYGDSSQWWQIAQANGLQSDSDLRAGQTLSLPSSIAGTNNNASTFKPYNQADVIGDTSPNLPIPHVEAGKCAGLSMVIGVIVAVVVTWFSFGNVVLGAAAGDAARQYSYAAFNGKLDGKDLAAGGVNRDPRKMANPIYSAKHPAGFTKNEYDYKSTVIAAAAAAAGGVAGAAGGAAGALAQAAASYATSTFLNAAVGRETNISLTGFATSMAAAYASYAVSDAIGSAQYGDQWKGIQSGKVPETDLGKQITRGLASGISGDVAAIIVDPKHRNAQSVWAGIVGTLVRGGMSAGSQSGGVDWSQAPDQSGAETARLNRYEGSALEQEAANNRTSLNAFNRDNDAYYATSYENWPDETGAEKARLDRYEAKPRFLERAKWLWDEEDAASSNAFLKQQNANADAYRREVAAAKARERFNFSDGRDASDIRLGFGYQSLASRVMAGSAPSGGSSYAYVSTSPGAYMSATTGDGLLAAERYNRQASGGLNPVMANTFHYQAALSVQDAAAQEAGGLVLAAGFKLAGVGWTAARGAILSEETLLHAELRATFEAGLRADLPIGASMEGLTPRLGNIEAGSTHIGAATDGPVATRWNPSGKGQNCVACVASYMTDREGMQFRTADDIERTVASVDPSRGIQMSEAVRIIRQSAGATEAPVYGVSPLLEGSPAGEYAMFVGPQKNQMAHVFSAERFEDGTFKMFDPQNGKSLAPEDLLGMRLWWGGGRPDAPIVPVLIKTK